MRFRLKNKKKLILILTGINLLTVGVGTAYSAYEDANDGNVNIASIAKIVFNNQITSVLSLPSSGLIPGDSAEYAFKVGNYSNGVRSDVNIDYRITIESFHFLPTTVKLYSVEESNNETLVVTCDEENGTRNEDNKLVCTTDTFTLLYSGNNEHNYKISIEFDETDSLGNGWSSEYSDIIDYVDVKIDSEQKTD